MDKKKYIKFADKWMAKFMDPNINDYVLLDPPMGEECASLGFKMDCGQGFKEVYGDASDNYKMLQGIIHQVTDIDLLGSAIYSQWRYFNHWAYNGSAILEPENRKWFIIALKRLKELAIKMDRTSDSVARYELTLSDKILQFADKWTILFENRQIEPEVLLSDEFAEECKELNFRDEGHKIYERCGRACCDNKELEKHIPWINNIEFLGCMVYSNWLYFKKFACYPEDILLYKNREWFLCTLNKMQELVLMDKINHAPVRKMVLYTDKMEHLGFNNVHSSITSEKITLNSQGRVWIKKSGWNKETLRYEDLSKENFSIDKKLARDILDMCDKYVPREDCLVDCAYWIAEFTREDGTVSSSLSAVNGIYTSKWYDLSEYIRKKLDRPDLMLFDNKPMENPIENITIDYKKDLFELDDGFDQYSFEEEKDHLMRTSYIERLSIDSKSGMIEYVNNRDGKNIDYKLEDEETILKLLNFFTRNHLFQVSHEFFLGLKEKKICCGYDVKELKPLTDLEAAEILKGQHIACGASHEEATYKLKITYRNEETMEFYGGFNRNELPFEYDSFIEMFRKVMTIKRKGDLFNPKLYKRGSAFPGEYIYCSVSFNQSHKTYYYIADSDHWEIGDRVKVPVGSEGKTAVGKIVDIDYFTKSEVPLPLEKTKHIIEKQW